MSQLTSQRHTHTANGRVERKGPLLVNPSLPTRRSVRYFFTLLPSRQLLMDSLNVTLCPKFLHFLKRPFSLSRKEERADTLCDIRLTLTNFFGLSLVPIEGIYSGSGLRIHLPVTFAFSLGHRRQRASCQGITFFLYSTQVTNQAARTHY